MFLVVLQVSNGSRYPQGFSFLQRSWRYVRIFCSLNIVLLKTLLKQHQQHPIFSKTIHLRRSQRSLSFPLSLQERYVVSQIPVWVEAAGETPLTHHKTQRQHKESTNSRHDIGNGHQHGLIRLRDVVATVFQVATVEWAFHRGCAKLVVHYSGKNRVAFVWICQNITGLLIAFILTVAHANSKADAFVFPVKDHVKALHDDGSHDCASARLWNSELIAVLLGRCHILYWPQVLLHTWVSKEKQIASSF